MFSDLLTLRNLVYLGIALIFVYTLWRSASGLLALKRRLVLWLPTSSPARSTLSRLRGLSSPLTGSLNLRTTPFSSHLPPASVHYPTTTRSTTFKPLRGCRSCPVGRLRLRHYPAGATEEEVVTAVEASTDEDVASVAASDANEPAAVDEEPMHFQRHRRLGIRCL
ncbi:hypothetical protein BC629DRAFT_1131027 [Irpex lacteus]|nr:hypothetical protein BC629DRAFT_1131027 [Irpex lacteus]